MPFYRTRRKVNSRFTHTLLLKRNSFPQPTTIDTNRITHRDRVNLGQFRGLVMTSSKVTSASPHKRFRKKQQNLKFAHQ